MPETAASAPGRLRSFALDVDRLLRGGYTDAPALEQGRVAIPVRTLVPACLLLGALYGATMGLYSALEPGGAGWLQVVSSALKVPLLFLLTLVVTFPSLYVVSALARSRLSAADTLRLLLAAVAVHLALLASLGPVAAFFTLSTDSYPFIKLLHVGFFAVSGVVGLGVLWKALSVLLGVVRSSGSSSGSTGTGTSSDGDDDVGSSSSSSGAVDERDEGRTWLVFRTWLVIYGCVGAQMGWILRPFVGAPSLEFTWFRERDSNILEAVFQSIGALFGAS